jgi:hypothetical protein
MPDMLHRVVIGLRPEQVNAALTASCRYKPHSFTEGFVQGYPAPAVKLLSSACSFSISSSSCPCSAP